ncbi:hypothetical protein ACF064_01415 [Streptomyces sp. NPDC015492]|uniref:hypothetical protein n=1 Tax=Streptomyces sp. NPDC015492 TaxID=3364958 RepID=UPI003701E263
MRQRPPACGIPVHLTPQDVERFTGIPDAAYEVREEQTCHLSWIHGGPHAALVQSSDIPGREWWAVWESGKRCRVVLLPCCAVTLDGAVDEDGEPIGCCLYACHGGEHVWMD